MPNLLIKFGTYTFPPGFRVESIPGSRIMGASPAPRNDGGRVLTGYMGPKRIEIAGDLIQGPIANAADWRGSFDSLIAAIASGPADLYAGYDDRYFRRMQCETHPRNFTRFGRIGGVDLSFLGPDPFEYVAGNLNARNQAISGSGETWTVTNSSGNAPAAPKISVTVGGSGAQTIAFTITNESTDESFTLAGAVTAGNVIIIDPLAEGTPTDPKVTINSVDKMTLFDGVFPRLAIGANSWLAAYTSSTITAVRLEWRGRYWS